MPRASWWVTLSPVLALLVTSAGSRAQTDPSPSPDALFASARPHLEAVLGSRLQRLPELRTVAPSELAALPDVVLDVVVRGQYPHLDDAARERLRAATLTSLRGTSVAVHQEGGDLILVAPANAATIAARHPSLAGARSPAFLRLAVVYETVRWVLDCRHSLAARRAACRDSHEVSALEALVEGRAAWVTRQVARRLDDEAAFPLLAEALRHAPEPTGDRAAAVLAQSLARRRHWAAVKGLAFFDRLTAEGETDAEARAFARPPRLVGWVERPELYLRAERLGLGDLGDLVARLETALPDDEWTARREVWTPAMIQQAAGLLGEAARVDKVVQGWDVGRAATWTGPGAPRRVAVGVVRFLDEAAAQAYYGLAVDVQRKQDELLGAAGGSRSQALRLAGADEAVRCDRQVRLGDKADPLSVIQVWARLGDCVVELTWQGVAADEAWAQRVVDVVREKR